MTPNPVCFLISAEKAGVANDPTFVCVTDASLAFARLLGVEIIPKEGQAPGRAKHHRYTALVDQGYVGNSELGSGSG